MELLRHINSLGRDQRAAFERNIGTTIGYLRKAVSTRQAINPVTCVAIETASCGAVMRWDLRPTDWWKVWPELRDRADAPAIPEERAA